MGYFTAVERVPSGVGKKCIKCLSPLLRRRGDREWHSPAVADQGCHSALLRIGEKTHRGDTIGGFVSLSLRCRARGGHQFPRAHKFVVCLPHPDSPCRFCAAKCTCTQQKTLTRASLRPALP